MKQRDKAYRWWKRKPNQLRQPLVFIGGVLLILIAPFIGWIPGPGGIVIFLAGIAILGSEFGWAKSLQAFFLHTVPAEVKKRWQPTPKWETTFDVTASLLIAGSIIMAAKSVWAPTLSLSIGGFCLALFNRNRLDKIKTLVHKK